MPAAAQALDTGLQWYSMKDAQHLAALHQKNLMVFAEAAWCVYCKQMDREAFKDPDIIEDISEYFYPVRVNIESDRSITFNGKRMTESQFAQEYDLHIPPKTLILDPQGVEIFSISGYLSEADFRKMLTLWQKAHFR